MTEAVQSPLELHGLLRHGLAVSAIYQHRLKQHKTISLVDFFEIISNKRREIKFAIHLAMLHRKTQDVIRPLISHVLTKCIANFISSYLI